LAIATDVPPPQLRITTVMNEVIFDKREHDSVTVVVDDRMGLI